MGSPEKPGNQEEARRENLWASLDRYKSDLVLLLFGVAEDAPEHTAVYKLLELIEEAQRHPEKFANVEDLHELLHSVRGMTVFYKSKIGEMVKRHNELPEVKRDRQMKAKQAEAEEKKDREETKKRRQRETEERKNWDENE